LLVAQPDPQREETKTTQQAADEIGGFYSDGAYTALPERRTANNKDEHPLATYNPSAGEISYHATVLQDFKTLQQQIRLEISEEDLNSLDLETYPITFPSNPKGYARLRQSLLNTEPQPTQIASFSQTTVFHTIAFIGANFLRRKQNISSRLSLWLWTLLAKVEDVGCLSSEEVSILRELGKRVGPLCRASVSLQPGVIKPSEFEDTEEIDIPTDITAGLDDDVSIAEGLSEAAKQDHPVASSDLTDEDILAAKRHILLSMLPGYSRNLPQVKDSTAENAESFPSRSTLATLDFILTVIIELYGQRDLIVHRNHLWASFSLA
jgi:hypothetical protein